MTSLSDRNFPAPLLYYWLPAIFVVCCWPKHIVIWRMTVRKVAHRQRCVDTLDFQSGKNLWFVVFAYFCGIITPTMGFRVLECTRSSAGYQPTPAYHCWTCGSPSDPQLLPLSPCPLQYRNTDLAVPQSCQICTCLTGLCVCIFLQLEYSSPEYIQVCLFLIFLKSAQVSSMVCQYKFAVFPHLLNTPFLCYILCFIIFVAFPTYYMLYITCSSFLFPSFRAGTFSSLKNS